MSGATDVEIYSWDTCVVLALLKNEADKPVSTIAALASHIQSGKAKLVVSTVMLAEILDVIENRQLDADIEAFFRLPSVQVIDVNRRVARRAAELRWQWRSLRKSDKQPQNLKVPDAVILATAQLGESDHLHSFDPDLLRFDGTAIAGGIKICPPRFISGQLLLPDRTTPPKSGQCGHNGQCHNLRQWGRPLADAEFRPRQLQAVG